MKKRFKEGITVSSRVNKSKLFFLFFLITFQSIFSQININGFCSYSEITGYPNYKKILPVNINQTPQNEFILYDNDEKNVAVINTDKSGSYLKPAKKFFYYPLTNIKKYFFRNGTQLYFFTSRKERRGGIFSITKSGTLKLLSQIKFKSFPDYIEIADVDGDNNKEILIGGSSFLGLSLLKEKNFVLKEEKITDNRIFSSAEFIDLDYDNFPDIAAYDLLNNQIVFLYNDQSGNFTEPRSIKLSGAIKKMKIYDYNSDGYEDLLYLEKNKLIVQIGDSVSSFTQKNEILLDNSPEDYLINDFNGDKINDIAYFNKSGGDLYIKFGLVQDSLSSPVLYLHDENILFMTDYNYSGSSNLIALSNKGRIIDIKTQDKLDEEKIIKIGGSPSLLTYLDYNGDNFNDICFIDDYNNTLNILLNNKDGVAEKFLTYKLFEAHKNLFYDLSNENENIFYCYSRQKNLIEILKINKNTNAVSRQMLYTFSPIFDLTLIKENKQKSSRLTALVNNSGILGIQSFEYRKIRYVSSIRDSISSGVIDASFTLADTSAYSFINITNDTLKLKYKNLFNDSYSKEVILTESMNIDKGIIISFDEQPAGKNWQVTLVNEEEKIIGYIYNSKLINLKIGENRNLPLTIDRKNIRFYYDHRLNQQLLYFYNSGNGTFYKLNFARKKSPEISGVKMDPVEIDNYFIADFFNKKRYLVYTNKIDNCITLKLFE